MSRIGKKPIPLPGGVKVNVSGNLVTVEGPLGKLQQDFRPEVEVILDETNNLLEVKNVAGTRIGNAMHGLYRALINNMVVGVSGIRKKTRNLRDRVFVRGCGKSPPDSGRFCQRNPKADPGRAGSQVPRPAACSHQGNQ